jgi:hypothetical protein
MRRYSAICAILVMLGGGAAADEACMEEIRALWAEGAAFDAYEWPPHRTVNTMHDADGNVTRVFTSLIETPLRTISGIPGEHVTLAIENDVWTGPDFEGPWEKSPQGFTFDRRASHAREQAQRAANLEKVDCPGEVERDGVSFTAYSFTTRTDPNEDTGGSWFGSDNTVYLDPETGRVVIWEMSDFFSSWAPKPNGELHVITYQYDPTITVTAPE